MLQCYPTPMRLQILLGLIISNLIWSANPLMGKLMLVDFNPSEVGWLRYTSGLVAYVIYRLFMGGSKSKPEPRMQPSDIAWVILLGGMSFCFSPYLQFHGLVHSNATDNALIVAMEPLITVALAWAFLKQRVSPSYLVSFFMSLMGFCLLAGLSWNGLQLERSHFVGNLLILVGLLGEAFYSIGGGKLLRKYSPETIFGRAIFSGVILLTFTVWIFSGESPLELVRATVTQIHWRSAGALFWLGPMASTATYLFWMVAMTEASVASMVLTLFIQPVFGAVWGYLLLNERLTFLQAVGGVLILVAVISQAIRKPAASSRI
jgi:drug/metabolite transporter (DMT)-like permease